MSTVRATRTALRSLVTTALLAVAPAVAASQTISFTHSGIGGSGTIGNTVFTSRNFTIRSTGNVANRTAYTGGFFIDHSASSIDIDGLGSFNFITGTRTFVNNGGTIVGFSRAGVGGDDLFNGPTNAAFAAWNMLSSIGPINGTAQLLQWSNTPVLTSGGTLAFNSQGGVGATFTAVVGPAVVVPEPSTYAMLAVAMSAMAVVLRRRGSAGHTRQ